MMHPSCVCVGWGGDIYILNHICSFGSTPNSSLLFGKKPNGWIVTRQMYLHTLTAKKVQPHQNHLPTLSQMKKTLQR